MLHRFVRIAVVLGSVCSFVACANEEDTGQVVEELAAVCTDDPEQVPHENWLCPEPHVVECSSYEGGNVARIYVSHDDRACDEAPELAVAPGPFSLGEHKLVVKAGEQTVCIADLAVVDTVAPALAPQTVELWPPNHKTHRVTVEDCADVVDTCDPDVRVWFTYIASDEPDDGVGDGSTTNDIVLDGCSAVNVRAERQGGGNGRVYTLGVRAVDASGNASDGVCRIVVPHDQSGMAPVEDEPAFMMSIAGCD